MQKIQYAIIHQCEKYARNVRKARNARNLSHKEQQIAKNYQIFGDNYAVHGGYFKILQK